MPRLCARRSALDSLFAVDAQPRSFWRVWSLRAFDLSSSNVPGWVVAWLLWCGRKWLLCGGRLKTPGPYGPPPQVGVLRRRWNGGASPNPSALSHPGKGTRGHDRCGGELTVCFRSRPVIIPVYRRYVKGRKNFPWKFFLFTLDISALTGAQTTPNGKTKQKGNDPS